MSWIHTDDQSFAILYFPVYRLIVDYIDHIDHMQISVYDVTLQKVPPAAVSV